MSQSTTEKRKSASFSLAEFEKEWAALEQSAKGAPSKENAGTGIKTPTMKVKQTEKETEQVVPTVTQTDTGEGKRASGTADFSHTPPVTVSREEKIKKLNFSSSVKSTDGSSNSSRKFDKSIESPRRVNISHRNTEKNSSNESPVTTPRGKEEEKIPAQLDSSTHKFRKQFSRKFTDIKLNLSDLRERMSDGLGSPPSSPDSAGRTSPSKTSPRKK